MEKEFGLSQDRLEDRFFTMRPEVGESSHAFVLRAEKARRNLGQGGRATLHCFLPQLDEAMAQEVEAYRRTKRVMQGTPLAWEDVVAIARDG